MFYDSVYGGGNYSTNEVFTGKYWIDGKKIYRKVVNFGALPNATSKAVAHGISNISTVIHQYGFTEVNDTFVPIPTANPQTQYSITMQTNRSSVVIITGTDRTQYSAKVILEYTKTTD